MLLRAQGTAMITGPLFAYASGFYGMSLTEHTDVFQGGALRGVPDTTRGVSAWPMSCPCSLMALS